MARKKAPPRVRRIQLSDRSKLIVLVTTGCLTLVVGGWWAYMKLTTVPPPPIETSTPQHVVKFLGDQRGFPHMRLDDREQYLADMYKRFGEGEARQELANAFAQMSSRERQVFVDTAIEGFKVRFLESANEYNRLPVNKRGQFVDRMIRTFESQRSSLAGTGSGGTRGPGAARGGRGKAENLGEPFKAMVPTTTDGMTKLLVSKSNSRQRAKAQPLFDAVAVRYKEIQDSRRAR
jgi:hypothetical protein